VVYQPPGLRGPTPENDLQPASIGVRGGGVSVAALKVWRDTYYTVNINWSDASAHGMSMDFGRSADWEPMRNLPVKTLYVQPNHFLCLGDNSRESSDGRSWGTVPKRLMLGRALMIYWPVNGRAGRIE
jgi:signal peptidase I